jgi:hypothetical protein
MHGAAASVAIALFPLTILSCATKKKVARLKKGLVMPTTPKPERKISLDTWAVALAFALALIIRLNVIKISW